MSKINTPKLKSALSGLTTFSWILITIFIIVTIFGISRIFNDRIDQAVENSDSSIPLFYSIGGEAVEAVDKNAAISKDNPQAIKDELIVKIPKKSDIVQFGNNITPLEDIPGFYKLKVEGNETLSEKQKNTASKPGVSSAEPNRIVFGSKPESTPRGAVRFSSWQWGINKINAKKAWRVSKGRGVIVAVVDTGIRTDHIAFSNGLAEGGRSFVKSGTVKTDEESCDNDGDWANDVNGHGTAVSSIITSRANFDSSGTRPTDPNFIQGTGVETAGVAPLSKILAIQSLGCKGGTNEWVARGIRYAANQGADVINLSLGSDTVYCSTLEEDAIKYALSKNVSVVASSGNNSNDIDCPARIPGVIAVGAIDRYDKLINHPDWWGSNYGKRQSVVAPGEQIATACNCIGFDNNWYKMKFNGTSAAAPFVAGTAALIKGINKNYSPKYIKKTIEETAHNPNFDYTSKHDSKFGYGIVDAHAAVLKAQ